MSRKKKFKWVKGRPFSSVRSALKWIGAARPVYFLHKYMDGEWIIQWRVATIREAVYRRQLRPAKRKWDKDVPVSEVYAEVYRKVVPKLYQRELTAVEAAQGRTGAVPPLWWGRL